MVKGQREERGVGTEGGAWCSGKTCSGAQSDQYTREDNGEGTHCTVAILTMTYSAKPRTSKLQETRIEVNEMRMFVEMDVCCNEGRYHLE